MGGPTPMGPPGWSDVVVSLERGPLAPVAGGRVGYHSRASPTSANRVSADSSSTVQ